jgi:hypothetical protein
MNLTRFLSFNGFSFLMDQASGDGAAAGGGAPAGAPAKATTSTTSNDSAAATAGTTAGDAAKASNDQTSAAASVPAGVGQDQGDKGVAPDFKTSLGELAKDPALASFNSTADLAKSFLETKKLVGQKLGIPGPDATPEAKAAFNEAMGVPKEAAGYEFKPPENLPAALKDTYDEANAQKWAGLFHKHGVPKEAANTLRNELFAEIGKELEGMSEAADMSDEAFGKVAADIYGDNAKADQAMQYARTIIEKHLPAPLKAAMGQLSNTALLAVAAAIRGETIALTGEDKTIGDDGQTTANGKTVAQLREENREMMKDPAYNSPFTPKGKQAHEDLTKKVKDNYALINQMISGGAKA